MTAKERPIIFSGPMVREIMAGRKTETRRLVRHDEGEIVHAGWPCPGRRWPEPAACRAPDLGQHHIHLRIGDSTDEHFANLRSPYGRAGDALWVRESFAKLEDYTGGDSGSYALACRGFFRADFADGDSIHDEIRWRPSIHMPRTMCRLRLKMASVHLERLQDIDDKGAIAEGVDRANTSWIHGYATERFQRLWDGINGKRASWASNPWVWVVRFEVTP